MFCSFQARPSLQSSTMTHIVHSGRTSPECMVLNSNGHRWTPTQWTASWPTGLVSNRLINNLSLLLIDIATHTANNLSNTVTYFSSKIHNLCIYLFNLSLLQSEIWDRCRCILFEVQADKSKHESKSWQRNRQRSGDRQTMIKEVQNTANRRQN